MDNLISSLGFNASLNVTNYIKMYGSDPRLGINSCFIQLQAVLASTLDPY